MARLDRRTLLKLFGPGAAVLSIGHSESRTAQAGGAKFASNKYQTFQPGVYFEWEKKMIEERLEQAKTPTGRCRRLEVEKAREAEIRQ